MSLTKKDKEEISTLISLTLLILFNKHQPINNENISNEHYQKKTAKLLYAYPILKRNVERYKKDIEDLYKEEFKTCPAVHHTQAYYGETWTVDEQRYAKKLIIEKNMYRDIKQIQDIDKILAEIKDDNFYDIIPAIFFENKSIEYLSEKFYCNKVTIYRNKKRLLNTLSIYFFGANAII